jgi:hypothetical protein
MFQQIIQHHFKCMFTFNVFKCCKFSCISNTYR